MTEAMTVIEAPPPDLLWEAARALAGVRFAGAAARSEAELEQDVKPPKRPLTLDEQLFLAIEELTQVGLDRLLVYMQIVICRSCAHLQAFEDVPGPQLLPRGALLFDFRTVMLAVRKRARA